MKIRIIIKYHITLNLILMRNLRKVDMVESLKSIE